MSKYCEQCGAELSDEEKFCPQCGTDVIDEEERYQIQKDTDEAIEAEQSPVPAEESTTAAGQAPEQEQSVPSPKSRKKLYIILSVCICVIAAGTAVGTLVIYPMVTQYMEQKENEEKAQRVVNLINSALENEITLDSEDDLNDIQKEYNALSADQKKLVKNYDKLEEAAASLEKLKKEEEDKEKAQEIIDRLDNVNKDTLAYDDTSIQEIRSAYDKLTDDQKKLVTNADLLSEYEAVVQEKKDQKAREDQQAQEEQAKRSLVSETFANLTYYEGLWDDFGAHVNKYQGAVEAAIKSAIRTSDYFDDPYSIVMFLTKQHECYFVSFEGVPSGNPNSGAVRLDLVVNAPDGMNFVCTVGDYYQL